MEDMAGNPEGVTPDILAEPVVHSTENIAQFEVDYMKFYAPSVLALLLQHIAATFAALSLVRDRLLGTNELFQATPLHAGEALLGKFLSYMLITLGIGGLLTIAIIFLLQVPFLGNPLTFLLMAVLEIAASLGWGFLISAVSKRESQAVQLTMIMPLTLVFSVVFSCHFPVCCPRSG
jgi:ABC-2 type transport system permease protein